MLHFYGLYGLHTTLLACNTSHEKEERFGVFEWSAPRREQLTIGIISCD